MFSCLLHLIFAVIIYDQNPPIIGVDNSREQATAHIEFLKQFMTSGRSLPVGQILYHERYTLYAGSTHISCLLGRLTMAEAAQQAANLVGKYNEIFDKAGNVKSLLPAGTYPLKPVGIVPTVPPAFNWKTFDKKSDKKMQDYHDAAADPEFVTHVTTEANQQNLNQRLGARRVIGEAYAAVSGELDQRSSDSKYAHPELQKLIQIEALIERIDACTWDSMNDEERKNIRKEFCEQAMKLEVLGVGPNYDDISGRLIYPQAFVTLREARKSVAEMAPHRTAWQAQEREKKAALEKPRAVLGRATK